MWAELPDSILGKDLFVLISIARGIGDGQLLGGMSWGFGDDWIWQFRRVDDNIHVVRRNVRFFADKGSPEEKAVDLAYTDSVLVSVPIATYDSNGAAVIDLSAIFMTDLPQIARTLPGFSFARDRSTWSRIKNFPDNSEIEVAATERADEAGRRGAPLLQQQQQLVGDADDGLAILHGGRASSQQKPGCRDIPEPAKPVLTAPKSLQALDQVLRIAPPPSPQVDPQGGGA